LTGADEIDILIPAYNEADRLPATIAAVRRAAPGRVIVVDDGSHDGTAEAARAAGADVVLTHATNRGKGAALNTGLAACCAPILLLIDADLGTTASEVAPLVEAVRAGRCEMAVAAFPRTRRKSGVGLAQGMARRGIERRTGRAFASPLSGQRCLRRADVEALGGFAEGFAVEVALTLGVLGLGRRVEEIPLPLSHRKTGRTLDGFLHRARQAMAIRRALRDVDRRPRT
jgi:glycosyltransferase involved in cell wall biosynthesis